MSACLLTALLALPSARASRLIHTAIRSRQASWFVCQYASRPAYWAGVRQGQPWTVAGKEAESGNRVDRFPAISKNLDSGRWCVLK